MFIPYSVDVAFDRRCWTSYVLFMLVLVVSFGQLIEAEHPNHWHLFFYFDIFPIFALFFLLGNLIFLWVFGRAVCSKLGNFAYVLFFLAVHVVPISVNIAAGGARIWVLGCVVSSIMGMYLVFWPENVVDCFLLIPPWRTFSIAGIWIVLVWLVFDALAIVVFEPVWGCLIHLSNFGFGIVTAVTLLKLKVVLTERDDRNLLQIILHEELSDKAWSESWSVRKAGTAAEEDGDSAGIADAAAKATPRENGTEYIRVLCQCGQVIEAPAGSEGKIRYCPKCSRKILLPHGSG